MSYFVVMIEYEGRCRQSVVDPEITRRGVIERIASGEYPQGRISFIHHIVMGELPNDVTEELIEEARAMALQAAE